jgi:FkbM family methyltransferase
MAEMVKCRVNGQYDIILPKHRADRPEWYTEKGWEKERMQNMRGRIDKGDVVLYVGNEEGDLSAIIASWGAKMVLAEPNPKVWPNTKVIWEANNLENPLACFVGFISSQSTYYKNDEFVQNCFPACADGPVIGDHGFMELRNHNAPEITIDELSRIINHVPDHISIDVEGSEWEVLKGAEQTIMQHKPILWVSIHPEFMIQQYGQYSADLRNWIKDRGYSETLLAYDHECHFMYLPI